MEEDEKRWQRLIHGLYAGDQHIMHEFCRQYADSLHRVAEKHLPRALQRRVGPEDVVQSVCRTFLRRAQGGEFRLEDSEGLWRLLCAITLTKVREQTRFHHRQKRGLAQEVQAAASDSVPGFVPVAPGPSPAEAVAFAEQLEQVLASLDDEERGVVQMKLDEQTNEQVAEHLNCSERTVRRILKRVQARWARLFDNA